MNIVFLGSSDYSLISLKILVENGHKIIALVCQPDKPNARGNKIEVSELKKYALSKEIPVYQFGKIRNEGVEILKSLNPDLLVVVYYGQILSEEIINIGSKGIINLHPSLLPKYRGPAPVITPILNGEKKTGVTIMRVAKDVDAGNILMQNETIISENETAGELWERLTIMGSEMLLQVIEKLENGKIKEKIQDNAGATFTRKIEKEDAKLDFNKSVQELSNRVRAFNPTPIAYFNYKEEKIKVYEAIDSGIELSKVDEMNFENGKIIKSSIKEGLIIKCNNGFLSIKTLQAPNGKVLDIKNFLNGKKFEINYTIK